MSSILNLSPKQLRQAAVLKEKLAVLQKQLEQLTGESGRGSIAAPGRKKRKLSAAARAKIVAAQKRRWAKFKAAKKAVKN